MTSGAGEWASWFPPGMPGLGALPDHVRFTRTGRWWADRPSSPRAAALTCAGYTLMGGDPRAVPPEALAPLAHGYFAVPDRFLPLLGEAFERVVPWERMLWVRGDSAPVTTRPVTGVKVTVRRLTGADALAVRGLGPDLSWIAGTWGGPGGLAASGLCWGAFREGRLLSLACTYFRGSLYEDIAVATRPEERGRGLATACVHGLCADITARGTLPTWTCSRHNDPSRRLAAGAGFRLHREYVHYAVGASAVPSGRQAVSTSFLAAGPDARVEGACRRVRRR
ncbi:GNAT family N-acetyltransferase [Streptomyces albireticuli]|uniref:GNAT family N-acetyltransferase n=2 Tax=Streptomyces albireticuli TaxID=1940 RepID=A0A2A2D3M8_9ACTN|nr:GNAT family N-acetyltransferase [Streptomyces albireticuli]